MMRKLAAALAAAVALAAVAPALAQTFLPRAATSSQVVTGGTAVTAVPANVNGCYITNPITTTDEGIAATEPIYVDPTGAVATTTGNGTSVAIQPGQTWFCVPFSAKAVSVNAATSGHSFVVVAW